MNKEISASSIAEYIKKQVGVVTVPCDHFTGDRGGYFNLILNDRIPFSDDYVQIERICGKGLIEKIEANGINRVSVFYNQQK